MGLPKIDHPTFDLTVPSTQENIKYRPFLVKEEKILLMAQESGQPNVFVDAITQVLNNCVFDYDISKMTSFDTEYLFLKLRANSVSDLAKVSIYDEETEVYEEVEIDLNEVDCTLTEQESLIKLNDLISIQMRYPSYDDLMAMEADSGLETSLEMISRCIDKVYNDEETLEMKDFSVEEQEEFVNSFPADTFAEIQRYFEDMPKVSMEVKYKIKVNGKQKTKKKVLQGINDFFS